MKRDRFANYVWLVLGYNLFVVLWGAYVRASGSGAGCGSHWPLCNGVVMPRAPAIETIIEFTHRITSGLALVMVVVMVVWAFRKFAPGHRVRGGAVAVLALMIVEALLGAGLVLFELVAHNDSMTRAFSMIAHLVNTFLLIAAISVTAWWASGGRGLRLKGQGPLLPALAVGLGGMLLIGASGAVAALGDTLFPARTFAEGFAAEMSSASHLLLRLRVLHPIIAIAVGVYLLILARWVVRRPYAMRIAARGVIVLVTLQLVAGAVNVWLLAPIWLQLLHLLLADLVWIDLVLLAASALQKPPTEAVTQAEQFGRVELA